jgi:hypothetical protein
LGDLDLKTKSSQLVLTFYADMKNNHPVEVSKSGADDRSVNISVPGNGFSNDRSVNIEAPEHGDVNVDVFVEDEERDNLALQLNLITEKKIAKLISLVEELRTDLPNVKNRNDEEAETMKQAIDPQAILETIQKNIGHTSTTELTANAHQT